MSDGYFALELLSAKVDFIAIDLSDAGIKFEVEADVKVPSVPAVTKSVFEVTEDELNAIAASVMEQLKIDPAMFGMGEEVDFEDEYYYYGDEYSVETTAPYEDYYYDVPESTVAFEYSYYDDYEDAPVTAVVAE